MATKYWSRVRKGTSGTRIFSAYLALVLAVAMVGPGLSVYAAEGVEIVAEPIVEQVVDPGPAPADAPEESPAKEADLPASELAEALPDLPVADAVIPEPEPSVEKPVTVSSVVALPIVITPSSLVTPVLSGNHNPPLTAGGVRIEDPGDGTYGPDDVDDSKPTVPADFEIVIETYETGAGWFFDWSSNYPISSIVVKGGSAGAYIYTYGAGVYSDTGLHAPANPNGKWAGLSHLDFYFGEDAQPETGDLVVYKFYDTNENGVHDPGEAMLENWEFTVTRETPPILDMAPAAIALIDSGYTDVDGELSFTGLDPGEYVVTETLKPGWTNTTTLARTVQVVAGETTAVWFGNIENELPPETGDLVVYKFYDTNENGVHDPGEAMLENWEFTVTRETPPILDMAPAAIALIDSGYTDVDGELSFTGLDPGEYVVTETLKPGWTNTTTLARTVQVVAGETTAVWFGNIEQFLPFTELDLAIRKLANKSIASPGELITYTLTYWNNGELSAENYTIVDDYDERYVTVVNANGGTVSGGKISWAFPGPLAKADGSKTLTYTVRVIADMPDGTTNVDNVVVIDHPLDSDKTNNTDNERVVVRVTDPFLPFTEPFLPFTGAESLMLVVLAALATTLGFALRLRSGDTV